MAYLPLLTEKQTFWTSAGAIASGYKLFIYAAGTTTKSTTYQETTGTANTNPVVLNSRGEVPYGVYVAAGSTYKLVLAPSTDSDPPVAPVWTRDNLSATNDTTVTVDQWQASGFTPTYVSATSFTVTGDRTSTFQVGRRIKSVNTGGTIYSTITVSAYASVTTVTVVNDSGTLDSGLSAVSVGLLTPTSPSVPLLTDAYPIVSGSSDKTKKLRLEVDGLTTATTRVLTAPNFDGTIATLAGTEAFTNKTLTSPVIDTGVSGTAIATQANQETGTSTSLLVTTGRQFYHPLHPKGVARVGIDGSTTLAYNVTNVTDTGAGDWTVNWSITFSTANNCALVTLFDSNSARMASVVSVAAGNTNVISYATTSTKTDPTTGFMIAVWGDL
jgi:hypothetical protein